MCWNYPDVRILPYSTHSPLQAFFVLHNGFKEAELEQKEKDNAGERVGAFPLCCQVELRVQIWLLLGRFINEPFLSLSALHIILHKNLW